MPPTNEVARNAILALLEARDFVSYQLSHANGGMSNEQLEEIAQKYCCPSSWDPTVLQDHVRVLHDLIGDRLDADVVSTVFQCSFEEARQALEAVSVPDLTPLVEPARK